MGIQTQSALIVALVCLVFTISFAVKNWETKRKIYYAFALLSFSVFLWKSGFFLYSITGNTLFEKIYFLGYFFLPPFSLYFTLHLLLEKDKGLWKIFRSSLGISFVLFILVFTHLFKKSVWEVTSLLYLLSMLTLCFYNIFLRFGSTSSAVERTRLQYLLIGGGLTISLGSADLITSFNVSFPSLGNMAIALYVYFISLAIINYRLLDLYEIMGKILISGSLILIISAIYVSMIIWTGGQTILSIFNTFIASFLILVFFEPVKVLLEKMTNNLFFRQKSEFKNGLVLLAAKLADAMNQDQLIGVVLKTLKAYHRISGSSIYLLDKESGNYLLKDKFSRDGNNNEIGSIQNANFISHIQSSKNPLLLDELEREIWEDPRSLKISELRPFSHALEDMNCQVSIPLVSQSRVIGFLNLKSEGSLESFSRDEIDLLIRVADQLALSLERVKIYEKIREKERLIALGEMAAGLAHEIRNPLGAIKGASQYLLPDINQSDASDLFAVINEEVDRLNRVVSRFLDYASPFSLNLQNSNINEIVSKSIGLISREHFPDNIEIDTDLNWELPEVEIDQDQLKQVFLNLILNGIQAMPSGGKLKITTSLMQNDNLLNDIGGVEKTQNNINFIQIKFEDSGEGIPSKDLGNIFTPFFTTKEEGVGLGLAISNRIMEAHGGDIKVVSQVDKGSQFCLLVPLHKKAG